MACFGTLLVCASPAIAARDEPSAPEALWKAFPLNPTGERTEKQRAETQRPARQPDDRRHEPFVPPTTQAVEETLAPASDRNARPVALVSTFLVLLWAALVALRVRRARASSSPTANEGGSSARLQALPVIGALVAIEALYGYAIYTFVNLL